MKTDLKKNINLENLDAGGNALRERPLPALPSGGLRARALVNGGLSRQRIKTLTDAGKHLHLGRGLYSLPESPVTENHALAELAARVPQGVVYLASAL